MGKHKNGVEMKNENREQIVNDLLIQQERRELIWKKEVRKAILLFDHAPSLLSELTTSLDIEYLCLCSGHDYIKPLLLLAIIFFPKLRRLMRLVYYWYGNSEHESIIP